MDKPRFSYILSTMTFLAVVSWMSVRAYDSMIGQIYYGPLQGFFASAFRLGAEESEGSFRTRVAIFHSDVTASNFGDPEKYGSLVVSWRRTLSHQGVASTVITGKDLASGALDSYNVLVLPFATHLSDQEINAIKAFVSQEGHGLIFSGVAGSHHENGDWREISLTAQIIGGEKIEEVAPAEGKVATMILDGKNPLSANLPPGLRMGVNTYDRPVSAQLLEPRTQSAGYWEEDAGAFAGGNGGRTSMASGAYRDGRFVWTGFTLGSGIDPYGVKGGDILARNMVAYAAFSPIFAKEAWPGGKQAAVVFSVQADEGFEKAMSAASLLARSRVPCTFFLPPQVGRAHPALLKKIFSNPIFEIALRGTGEQEGQPRKAQAESLEGAKRMFESLTGRSVTGFSPFDANYKNETLVALLDSHFTYLAGGASHWGTPSVLQAHKPRFLRIGRDLRLLIKFPYTGGAEGGLLKAGKKEDGAAVLKRLKRDFDAVYEIGGFYSFSFHPSVFDDKARRDILEKFLEHVASKNVWLANYAEVAAWSNRWMLVDIESIKASETRSNLIVTNSSSEPIDSLRINMYFPGDSTSIAASSEKMGGGIKVIAKEKGKAILEMRGVSGEGLVFFVDREGRRKN